MLRDRSKAVLYLLATAVLLPACEVSAGGDDDADAPAMGTRAMMTPAAVDSAVQSVRARYVEAFGSGPQSATRLPELYTPDAVYSDPTGTTHSGHAAIRQAFSQALPAGAVLQVHSFGAVGSGDVVVDMGTYTNSIPQPDGQTVQQQGRFMVAIQRMDDGVWRIVRHVSAPANGGPAPMPRDSMAASRDTTAAARDSLRMP